MTFISRFVRFAGGPLKRFLKNFMFLRYGSCNSYANLKNVLIMGYSKRSVGGSTWKDNGRRTFLWPSSGLVYYPWRKCCPYWWTGKEHAWPLKGIIRNDLKKIYACVLVLLFPGWECFYTSVHISPWANLPMWNQLDKHLNSILKCLISGHHKMDKCFSYCGEFFRA